MAATDRMSLTVAASRILLFDVEAYSVTKQLASHGEYYLSDSFSVGGYYWAVRYYPRNMLSFCKGISIFLVLLSEAEDVCVGANFACTLLDKSGEPSKQLERSWSHVFSRRDGRWHGFTDFLGNVDLEASEFLAGDCFVLQCTVSVLKKPVRDSPEPGLCDIIIHGALNK